MTGSVRYAAFIDDNQRWDGFELSHRAPVETAGEPVTLSASPLPYTGLHLIIEGRPRERSTAPQSSGDGDLIERRQCSVTSTAQAIAMMRAMFSGVNASEGDTSRPPTAVTKVAAASKGSALRRTALKRPLSNPSRVLAFWSRM